MEAIFDPRGETVAWRHRDAIFDGEGVPRALIRDRCVYTTDGRFVGRFQDGFYRDGRGQPVAFERDATGGPLPPSTKPRPVAPMLKELPYEPDLETPPPPPRFRSRDWSGISWEAFLNGAGGRQPA
ncbi:MAG: hypothetical protein U5Q44_02515 [Dehalococcoidia bacterium]|nr:hypothetical protein [Dehalococcoidia bacterium]